MTHRPRAASPPRIYLDPRASTGTVLTSSYDTRYDTRPGRTSFSTLASAQPATRGNSIYETQPVSKRTYADPAHGGGTISRTEYAVRPRRDSATGDSRRPLSVVTKNVSPTRERPDYTDSPRDMVIYKQARDDPNRLLQPTSARGSAHHQRHNSATRAEAGRYVSAANAPRVERAYHARGPYVEKVADSRTVQPRYTEEPAVEYTTPREQFDRDYPPPRPRRESLTRKERPSSAMDTKFDPAPLRRDSVPVPPSASRQLQRLERDDRRSGFESDPDRSRNPHRRRSSRGAVVHQRDDGYSSARDEYDPRRSSKLRPTEEDIDIAGSKSRYRDANREVIRDADRDKERVRRDYDREDERLVDRDVGRDKDRRRVERPKEREYERERERPRPREREYEIIEDDDTQPRRARRREPRDERDTSPDNHTGLKTLATAAIGGLAATGIVSRKSAKEEEESDPDSRKERKHRRRKSKERREAERYEDEDASVRQGRGERRALREDKVRDDSSGSDTPQESTRRRPQSRTRQRRNTQESSYGSDHERLQAGIPPSEQDRKQSRMPDLASDNSELARDSILERSQQESPTSDAGRTLSPGEGEDGRPRKVSIVEPNRKEDLRPRGILKPPRVDPFPEDPNPSREGVAPLKQAGKEGIPAAARWTKVSRILVNPEALEKAHERYEERDEYVIILRVLSREDIEKLAEKTREIRGNDILPYA